MSRDKYAKYSNGKVTHSSNGDGARHNYSEIDNGIQEKSDGCFLALLLPLLLVGGTLLEIALYLSA